MVVFLEFLADFVIAMFTIISGLVGVFIFLLMVLTGWIERKQKPTSSKILLIGGMGMLIIWLWIRIIFTIGGNPTWLATT
jgi:hypothetical protein